MKEAITEAVKNSTSLAQVRDSLFVVFRELRQEGFERIGYVSGIITSEGMDHMAGNIERLARFTDSVRNREGFPVFSATDVFDDILFKRLSAAGFQNEDWLVFWREVLGTGDQFVTDIFMTPRWEISQGATVEHDVAQRLGMVIHYITDEI